MTATVTAPSSPAQEKLAGKYLTFRLGEESYGLDVLHVREIIRPTHITPVPRSPAWVRGVANLRGKIIEVIDLKCRLGLASSVDTAETCLVVVMRPGAGKSALVGLMVDRVEEVLAITPEQIAEAPDFGLEKTALALCGLAKIKNKVKPLLDLSRILTMDGALPTENFITPPALKQ